MDARRTKGEADASPFDPTASGAQRRDPEPMCGATRGNSVIASARSSALIGSRPEASRNEASTSSQSSRSRVRRRRSERMGRGPDGLGDGETREDVRMLVRE